LGPNATISDVVRYLDNPVLRPHTVGALDPLSNTLGLDGGMLTPGQMYRRQFTTGGLYLYQDGVGHVGQVLVTDRNVYLPLVFKN
jgi:hypothetical protein